MQAKLVTDRLSRGFPDGSDLCIDAFGLRQVLTKAIPDAVDRVSALLECGFLPTEQHRMRPHCDYLILECAA